MSSYIYKISYILEFSGIHDMYCEPLFNSSIYCFRKSRVGVNKDYPYFLIGVHAFSENEVLHLHKLCNSIQFLLENSKHYL